MIEQRFDVLDFARTVLQTEAQAISSIIPRLNDNFVQAVDAILECKGRIVVTGMGKSGLIGKKIAATFASTGTPAMFMHPADAIHGDLGMIVKGDVVLALSYSGETGEITGLLDTLNKLGVTLISIVGNPKSKLAQASTIILDIEVDHEACPLGLAPSASTTATLAMGDALALVLLKRRGFSEEDFARFHPGGKLGKRLMRVKELMISGEDLPLVTVNTPMKDSIYEISSKGLGVSLVVNEQGTLVGILTDGDLRRAIERDKDMITKKSSLFMSPNPKTIHQDEYILKGVRIMDNNSITALAITDSDNKPIGILKLQDILKEGVI